MKPRHDIPSRRRGQGRDTWSAWRSARLDMRMSDPLVDRAMEQMRGLMAEGRLQVSDIERFELLLKQSRRRRAPGKVRIELIRFVGELMSRRGSSPGASPMPAPVFPNGGPTPLAGAAEAPLD